MMTEEVLVPVPNKEGHSVVTEAAQVFLIDYIGPGDIHRVAPLVLNLASLLDTAQEQTRWERFCNVFKSKQKKSQNIKMVIESPYKISEEIPVLDFYINGYGNDFYTYSQIATAISLAKSRGVICRTTVTGMAAGIAGMLAAMGTPGFRVMYENTYNCLVIPRDMYRISTVPEVGFKPNSDKQTPGVGTLPKWGADVYQKNTNLTPAEMEMILTKRDGHMDTKFCATHGVCDWVLRNNGFVECVMKQRKR